MASTVVRGRVHSTLQLKGGEGFWICNYCNQGGGGWSWDCNVALISLYGQTRCPIFRKICNLTFLNMWANALLRL